MNETYLILKATSFEKMLERYKTLPPDTVISPDTIKNIFFCCAHDMKSITAKDLVAFLEKFQ